MKSVNVQLDFSNTEKAYKHKSDAELKHAYRLYKLLNNQTLSGPGQALLKFSVKLNLPINGIIKATLYKHFIGGESLDECIPTMKKLAQFGVGTIPDYAVEGKGKFEGYENTLKEFHHNIDFAARNKSIPFTVFKTTAIASPEFLETLSNQVANGSFEDVPEYKNLENTIDGLFKHAAEDNVPMMIDAEESWLQPIIDHLAMLMAARYNTTNSVIVVNTYQMYRKDRLKVLQSHHQAAEKGGFKIGAKLVRGAYMEKEAKVAAEKGWENPIFPTKAQTDKSFNDALRYCLSNMKGISCVVATHNELSTFLAADYLMQKDIPTNHESIYFSQLYGMCDHITHNLADKGFNVTKYMPYGPVKFAIPYLVRRAEENASVAGQAAKEISLIGKELSRRSQGSSLKDKYKAG